MFSKHTIRNNFENWMGLNPPQPSSGYASGYLYRSVHGWWVAQAGVDADNILAAAHTLSHADKAELQDRTLLLLTNQIDRFLASRSVDAPRCQCNAKSLLSTCCCRLCNSRFVCLLSLTVTRSPSQKRNILMQAQRCWLDSHVWPYTYL